LEWLQCFYYGLLRVVFEILSYWKKHIEQNKANRRNKISKIVTGNASYLIDGLSNLADYRTKN